MPDPSAIEAMFARIASRYDLANRVLSLGMDRDWRRKFVYQLGKSNPGRVLDLATGSGDVAFAIARRLSPEVRVTGMDFCKPMLDEAATRQSASGDPRLKRVGFRLGDALAIPVEVSSFDAVTIAFGLRNVADRPRALSEIRRVLRPGGYLHVLEFSQPAAALRPFYYFYLKQVAPFVAGLLTGEPSAYRYLAGSIGEFPDREQLADEIRAAGFSEVSAIPMTCGIVAIHSAKA